MDGLILKPAGPRTALALVPEVREPWAGNLLPTMAACGL